jgi:SAM-dependent methyltransferase
MKSIEYSHSQNTHILDAPSVIFPIINEVYKPDSILDVGCGTGTWLKIILDCGIEDFLGIDGIEVANKDFFVSKERFQRYDLTSYWSINRKFDIVLCLEVAEHLPIDSASNFIKALTNHSDTILFSAACPNQPGQGHINCQSIEYWQQLFNEHGYACYDEIRPVIWNEAFPEWWYKQNILVAKKDEDKAGKEARILSMIHPDLYEYLVKESELFNMVKAGDATPKLYLQMLIKSIKKQYIKLISN